MEVDIFNTKHWEKPTNLEDGIIMIRNIKSIFPIACIIWQPEDVICYAKDHDPVFTVTQEQAEATIERMENCKDCCNGITWDLLADCLEFEIEEDDEPGICPNCNGSGEGMHDGTTCTFCKGSGEARREGNG